ncbi:helix-turn-helix domain-containing protein [Kitasatospora sp. NPDC056446]|uniref:helix-turn-helix domain-containing protein n=1 Tax=Kitasatospora sp. NPDC056446 TaxID=3345819 RepID=UPI0036C66A1B
MSEQVESFGALLRRTRVLQGLSQEELGKRSGITARAISNLERGCSRPRGNTLRELIKALDLDQDHAAGFLHAATRSTRYGDGHRNDFQLPYEEAGLLTDSEVVSTLRRLSLTDPTRWEPRVTETLLAACSGQPSAVRLLGAVLAVQPELPLAALADRLCHDDRRCALLPR